MTNLPSMDGNSYRTFVNSEEGDKGDSYTVEEAVEKIGFGKFQVFTTFTSGFAWIADGMEIMVLSILGPVLMCEWRISSTEEALLTTIVFAGFLLGSPVFGWTSDKFGRKKSLMYTSMWVFIFGLICAAAPQYTALLILRFMVGFGIAGSPQVVTYCSEFLPNKSRGKTIILVEVFFALGGMAEVVLAILILLPYGWRWWLVASAVPCFLYVIFCIWLPESPRFDLVNSNPEKAQKTLEWAAKSNGVALPPGELVPEPQKERGNIKDLFVPELRRTTIINAYLWFASAFSYYGVVLFTTELIRIGSTCNPNGIEVGDLSQNSTLSNGTVQVSQCQELELSDYYQILWTSLAELPGIFLAIFLIDILGRRWTMALEFLLFSALCFIISICMDKIPMVIVLFLARALISSAFQVLYVYTSEVYPTPIRALSVGLGSMMGRFGALITPYIAEVLLETSLYYAMCVYAFIGLFGAILSCFLTIETKGKSLKQTTSVTNAAYELPVGKHNT